MICKRLDYGCFELPRPTSAGQAHVVVSDALFAAIFGGNGTRPNKRKSAWCLAVQWCHGDDSKKSKPSGRRNLAQSSLPRIEVEIEDPRFEGKCPRSGFDVSYQLYLKRSSYAVLVKKIAKYTVTNEQGTAELSAEQPKTLFDRGLLHTSTVADIITRKFSRGEPLARQEQHFVDADSAIDRGTMSRYVEQAGNTFGATVVHAMWQDALKNAGVISTDATGAAIQPEAASSAKQSCKKGHFFYSRGR
ncbi:MAG: transposase, partial [Deltaproteobacteria bacterium]|nr:transposase [Deltaproteobacteria bacterium]